MAVHPIVQIVPHRRFGAVQRVTVYRRWLSQHQERGMDGLACHSESHRHWRRFDDLDKQSDAKLREALREARARQMHRIADLIEEGLSLDHQERKPLARIHWLFGEAASACRAIVQAVEKLFGRGRDEVQPAPITAQQPSLLELPTEESGR